MRRAALALSTVAARAAAHPGFPLAVLTAQLRDAGGRLDALDAGDPATSMRAVLSWSCRHLSPAAAAMFRLLGTHSGPDISAAAAASLTGLAARDAREALAVLTRAHLIAEHVPSRFSMHDLVRAYAAEQACAVDSDTARRDALRRVLDHYLHTGLAADRLLCPGRELPPLTQPPHPGAWAEDLTGYEQALAWFEAERPVLLAAIAEAAAAGLVTHAWLICWALEDFADIRGHWHDTAWAQRTTLSAAEQAGDMTAQAHAHHGLGRALFARGDGPLDEARTHVLRALDLFTELGDHTGQARAHSGLGGILDAQGRHRERSATASKPWTCSAKRATQPGRAKPSTTSAGTSPTWENPSAPSDAWSRPSACSRHTATATTRQRRGTASVMPAASSAITPKPSPATSDASTCAARTATPTARPTRSCALATHTRPPGTRKRPATPGSKP